MRPNSALAMALVAILPSCAKIPPGSAPGALPGPPGASSFVSQFEARVSAPEGSVRFRGVLAAAPGGRLRIELTGPSVAAPLLLVAGPEGISALLLAERLFYRGPAGAPLIEEISGLPARPADLAGILTGERSDPPVGCKAWFGRWAFVSPDGRIPRRVKLRCGAAALRVSLEGPRPLPPRSGDLPAQDPFAPIAPRVGDRVVDLPEFVRALRPAD